VKPPALGTGFFARSFLALSFNRNNHRFVFRLRHVCTGTNDKEKPMSEDWTPEIDSAAVPNASPLIELMFKPDALGKRPAPAEIQFLLSHAYGLLAEAERELQRMIDGPDKMREHEGSSGVHNPDADDEVSPCR
jgi:hypothetical protein